MIRTTTLLVLLPFAESFARIGVVHVRPDNVHAHPITVTVETTPEGRRTYSVFVALDRGYEPGDVVAELRLIHGSEPLGVEAFYEGEKLEEPRTHWQGDGVTFEFVLTAEEAGRALLAFLVSHSSADAREAEAEGAVLALSHGTSYVVYVGEFVPKEAATSTKAETNQANSYAAAGALRSRRRTW